MTDVEGIVGGKNASLGEMIGQLAEAGVRVPTGFATTALAFRDFLHHNGYLTERIAKRLEKLDVDDVKALAEAGKEIRHRIVDALMQPRPRKRISAPASTPCKTARLKSCRLPCVRRQRRKICRTHRSRGSRKATSTWLASTRCSIA